MSANDPPKNSDGEKMYYIENGLMVFTEAYHLDRGKCCGNGCRHCPFGYKNVSKE